MRYRYRNRQTGVALVTAILLVAIATLLAARIAWDNQLNMRRTTTAINLEQARQLALGAEAAAIEGFYQLRVLQGIQYDDPATWSFFVLQTPAEIEGEAIGFIDGSVRDVQGKLNVNNLINATDGQVDTQVQDQFRSLLSSLQLDQSILDALIDWIDFDTVPQTYGAEDGSYTSRDPAYRPANNYFFDPSEFRSVLGIDPESFSILAPYITALPPGWCGPADISRTQVNLNFAAPEVLAAILGISLNEANNVLGASSGMQRPAWENLADIAVSETASPTWQDYATTVSTCAEVRAVVTVGSTTLTMYSLLDRSNTTNTVVNRVRAFGLD